MNGFVVDETRPLKTSIWALEKISSDFFFLFSLHFLEQMINQLKKEIISLHQYLQIFFVIQN